MQLYAVSKNGRMLYFYGDVPPDLFYKIEVIANCVGNVISDIEFCDRFTKKLRAKLNVELVYLPVSHVFRVR